MQSSHYQNLQALRPSVSRAFAADAVSTQSAGGEADLRQGWDELQSIATTSEGRKELADLRRLVSELTMKPEAVCRCIITCLIFSPFIPTQNQQPSSRLYAVHLGKEIRTVVNHEVVNAHGTIKPSFEVQFI